MTVKQTLGINALFLNPQSGGLGVYLYRLVDYLCRIQTTYKKCIFVALDSYPCGFPESSHARFVPVGLHSNRPLQRIAFESLAWRHLLSREKIDLLHSPLSYIPLGVTRPTVVTIHDLRAFREPEAYSLVRGQFIRHMVARSIRKACHLIAISEFTRSEIADLFNVPDEKISVIYQGVDHYRFSQSASDREWQEIRLSYGIPENYILSVGHLEPRKNYVRLLHGYHLLVRRHGAEIPALVIVGRENWKFDEIYQTVNKLNLNKNIKFTHFVKDQHLAAIYQHAQVFITASIYEGFGITPLESMAAGTPVACSNHSALPEVVGEAALLFDPFSVEEISDAMYQLLYNQDQRAKLNKNAKSRLQLFDWDKTNKQTLKTYQNVLDSL